MWRTQKTRIPSITTCLHRCDMHSTNILKGDLPQKTNNIFGNISTKPSGRWEKYYFFQFDIVVSYVYTWHICTGGPYFGIFIIGGRNLTIESGHI